MDSTAPIELTVVPEPSMVDEPMPHTIELPLIWGNFPTTCRFQTDLRRWTLNGQPIFRVPQEAEDAWMHTKAGAAPLLSLFDPAVVEALRVGASE